MRPPSAQEKEVPHAILRGVTRVYSDAAPVHALGPLDLDLAHGEFFSVVGPSGCGKSTLLDVLAGLSPPTVGSVSFEGKPVVGDALMLFVLLIATGVNGALHVWDRRLGRRRGRHDAALRRDRDGCHDFTIWLGVYAYAGEAAITPPLRTFAFAVELFSRASFWNHVGATMTAFAMAFTVSAMVGIALGLLLGLRRFAGDVADPILSSLYTIPKVTLYPIMLLIFGLGMSAKVAFGVIHGMIPIMLFTIAAVKNIQPVLLRTARVLRLGPTKTALNVLAPAVTPEIITGLRVGCALTLLGVLIGEMFASQRGLGFLIINGMEVHDVRMMTTVTLIVVAFAIAANGLLLALDRRAHRFAQIV